MTGATMLVVVLLVACVVGVVDGFGGGVRRPRLRLGPTAPLRMGGDAVVTSVETTLGHTHSVSFEVAGKTMRFETGKMGRQASGAVVAAVEESVVYR